MSKTITRPFMPPSSAERGAAWRASFVREATVRSLIALRGASRDDVELEMRGAVTQLKASDFPQDSVAALMQLANDTALSEVLALAVPVDLRGVTEFSFPLPSSFGQAHFVEEGRPIPAAQGSFAGMMIGPVKKVALITALSAELESYSAPVASTVISHLLRVSVSNGALKVLLSADAATPAAPAGLLNGVPPIVAGTSATADLQALIGAIAAAGIDTRSVAFLAAPAQALALRTQPWPNFDHEIIEVSTLAPGTLIAIAADGFVVAGEGVPEVTASKHGVFHMNDTPSDIGTVGAPGVVAAPAVSMYQVDSFALRCVCWLTWAAAPGAVSWIQDTAW
jgi:hypothetical protein